MLAFGVKVTTSGSSSPFTVSSVSSFPTFYQAFGTGKIFYCSFLDSSGAPIATATAVMTSSTELTVLEWLTTFESATYDDTDPAAPTLSGTITIISSMSPRAWAANWFYPLASGDYIHNGFSVAASGSTFTLTMDRLYMAPFLLPCAIRLVNLCASFSAVGTSPEMRLGLYSVGPDGYPYGLLWETGAVALSATNTTYRDPTGTSMFLPSGVYWYGMVFTGTGTTTIRYHQLAYYGIQLGDNGGFRVPYTGMYKAHTFGALPTTSLGTGWTMVAQNVSATPFGLIDRGAF